MQTDRSFRRLVVVSLLTLPAGTAAGQDFNLDVGAATGNPVPAATFGGAAARPGTWGIAPVVATTPQTLTDIHGTVTGVTSTMSGGTLFADVSNLPGASIDDLSLMSDIQDPGSAARTWTFDGLAAGLYDVYTYAMAPDETVYRTNVSVAGSADPQQTIGGAWPNAYVQGVTHAKHRVAVSAGGPLVVTVVKGPVTPPNMNAASVNGFQIVAVDEDGSSFCSGDGTLADHTTPCPCGNNGAAGNGCANSANASGANLAASGATSADDVVLSGSGMPATVACIYLQGDGLDDVVFGDGVRCTGGTLIRLRTKINAGGASTFPEAGVDTITLSARGGVVPGSGAVRRYQTYYRNSAAAFCPPETFNVTNGWTITW